VQVVTSSGGVSKGQRRLFWTLTQSGFCDLKVSVLIYRLQTMGLHVNVAPMGTSPHLFKVALDNPMRR